MITDVDTCLREIVDWFIKNRRGITTAEIQPILRKHCESEAEMRKIIDFLETEPGEMRFRTLLREKMGVKPERKFPMGQIVMTRGVNDLIAENTEFSKFVSESLGRHARGDWGDLSEEDKKENEYSLTRHLRLLSAYEKLPLRKIWIITEADRSVTTVLFPEEY